jgi:hypothetical protein
VLPGGAIQTLASSARGERSFGSAVAAMPDGSVLLSRVSGVADLVRLSQDGTASVLRQTLPVGGEAEFTSDPFDDLAVRSDGSALIARHGRRRVLHVAASGRVRIVAGGGRGFVEGARATEVDLGAVTAVAAWPDGGVLLSADRGVFIVGRDGRLQRVTDGTAYEYDPVEARALTTDGQYGTSAMLAGVRRLDALDDGTILALTAGADRDTRVVAISPLRQHPRLSVALPPANRASLPRGRLDVLATRPAQARITIAYKDRVLRRALVPLRAGHNRVRVRVPSRPEALVARASATATDGSVATHRLAFLSDWQLSAREMHRVRRLVEDWSSLAVNAMSIDRCRRTAARSFRCRWEDWAEGDLIGRGRAVISRSRDGLIRYMGTSRAGQRRTRLVFEPR